MKKRIKRAQETATYENTSIGDILYDDITEEEFEVIKMGGREVILAPAGQPIVEPMDMPADPGTNESFGHIALPIDDFNGSGYIHVGRNKYGAMKKKSNYTGDTFATHFGDLTAEVGDSGVTFRMDWDGDFKEDFIANYEKEGPNLIYELLEDFMANGWTWVDPAEIGALVSDTAPIMSDPDGWEYKYPEDEGVPEGEEDPYWDEKKVFDRVFWYPNYQVTDPLEDLIGKDEMFFEVAGEPSEKESVDEAPTKEGVRKRGAFFDKDWDALVDKMRPELEKLLESDDPQYIFEEGQKILRKVPALGFERDIVDTLDGLWITRLAQRLVQESESNPEAFELGSSEFGLQAAKDLLDGSVQDRLRIPHDWDLFVMRPISAAARNIWGDDYGEGISGNDFRKWYNDELPDEIEEPTTVEAFKNLKLADIRKFAEDAKEEKEMTGSLEKWKEEFIKDLLDYIGDHLKDQKDLKETTELLEAILDFEEKTEEKPGDKVPPAPPMDRAPPAPPMDDLEDVLNM